MVLAAGLSRLQTLDHSPRMPAAATPLPITVYQQKKRIVDDAMRVAATYVPLLEKASTVISEIDVLASFAHVAAYHCGVNGGYCRPIMTDSDENGMGIKVRVHDLRIPL